MPQPCNESVATTPDATAVLGAHAFDRPALFVELARERNAKVPYRTFYNWCQLLGIDPGAALYSADDVLLLLTTCWAYQRHARNLNLHTVQLLQESYIQCRIERSSKRSRTRRASPAPSPKSRPSPVA